MNSSASVRSPTRTSSTQSHGSTACRAEKVWDAVCSSGANHSASPTGHAKARTGHLAMPFMAPFSLVNTATLRLFNFLYYHRPGISRRRREHFQSFFFPLDSVANWNRLYGQRGFYQYQCVIPEQAGPEATAQLLEKIARSGQGSFLAVLKQFGRLSSPGMLSFPRCGVTLALDFPKHGRSDRAFVHTAG